MSLAKQVNTKMIGKLMLVFCSLLLVKTVLVKTQEVEPFSMAGCEIEGIDTIHWLMGYENPTILDTFEGDIATFITRNVHEVEIVGTDFFAAELNGPILRIFTTEQYKSVEPKIGYIALPRIRFSVVFSCSQETRTLGFSQRLTDTNNHDPFFAKEEFVYIYQSNGALPVLYEFTNDQDIIATDIDMTNNALEFSIDHNQDFLISSRLNDRATRQSFALLRSLREFTPPFTTRLNIHATDVRKPTRNTSAILEVNVLLSSDGDVPDPIFSNSSYTATYKNGTLVFNEEIRLSTGAGYLANIKQLGYENLFKTSFSNRAEGILNVELLNQTDDFSQENFSFGIELANVGATQAATATINVRVRVEEDQVEEEFTTEIISCSLPTLSRHTYLAKYLYNGLLVFEDKIQLFSEDLDVKLTQNGWNDNFESNLVKDTIPITVTQPLPTSVLENNAFILFDINVTKNGISSCSTGASILIELPRAESDESFSFERPVYVVYYDGTLLSSEREIFLMGNINVNSVVLTQSDFTDAFFLKVSPTNNAVKVALINTLKRADFDRNVIIFDITASTFKPSSTARTSIIVVWNGPVSTRTIFLYNNAAIYLCMAILSLVVFSCVGFCFIKYIRRKNSSPPPPAYTEFENKQAA